MDSERGSFAGMRVSNSTVFDWVMFNTGTDDTVIVRMSIDAFRRNVDQGELDDHLIFMRAGLSYILVHKSLRDNEYMEDKKYWFWAEECSDLNKVQSMLVEFKHYNTDFVARYNVIE